jgi:septum site-determining protein MinD
MCKVYVVTSGKGGVGKTTIVSKLSESISELNKKVLVIDMDTGLRNLDIVMGLENRILFNLIDVLKSNCKIEQAIINSPRNKKLYLLPTSQIANATDVNVEDLFKLLDILRYHFDFIIIDSPAGVGIGFTNSIRYADEALVVVQPDITSLRDADKILNLLAAAGITCSKIIVNKYDSGLVKSGHILSVDDIQRILGAEDVFCIPYNNCILKANNFSEDIYKRNNKLTYAYKAIAKSLI